MRCGLSGLGVVRYCRGLVRYCGLLGGVTGGALMCRGGGRIASYVIDEEPLTGRAGGWIASFTTETQRNRGRKIMLNVFLPQS